MRNAVRLTELPQSAQKKQAQPRVSIVIPIHNEESFLTRAASDLHDALTKMGLAFELILCENGSTDRTLEVAHGLADELGGVGVLSADVPDYGRAMRAGVLAARAPYIVVFDIDYYSVDFLLRALDLLKDYDIVVASKVAPGAEDRRSVLRKVITRGFRLTLKALFSMRANETHGMKAFRRKRIEPIVMRTRMAKDIFDTELIIRAERAGLNIKEVPVVVEEKRAARSSILKRIPRTMVSLLLLRYFLWKERFNES